MILNNVDQKFLLKLLHQSTVKLLWANRHYPCPQVIYYPVGSKPKVFNHTDLALRYESDEWAFRAENSPRRSKKGGFWPDFGLNLAG